MAWQSEMGRVSTLIRCRGSPACPPSSPRSSSPPPHLQLPRFQGGETSVLSRGGRPEEDCYWLSRAPNPTRAETGKGNPGLQPACRSYDHRSMAGTGVTTEQEQDAVISLCCVPKGKASVTRQRPQGTTLPRGLHQALFRHCGTYNYPGFSLSVVPPDWGPDELTSRQIFMTAF